MLLQQLSIVVLNSKRLFCASKEYQVIFFTVSTEESTDRLQLIIPDRKNLKCEGEPIDPIELSINEL